MFFSSDLAYQSCCLSGMLTLGEARDYNVPFTDIRGCNRKRPTPKMMVGQMKASVIVLCHLLVKKYLSQKSQWTQQPGIYLSKIFYQGTPRLWFHSRGHCSQRSCHRELGWQGRAASFDSESSCPSPKPPPTPWAARLCHTNRTQWCSFCTCSAI